jgi:16S rRNA (guanine527-N7)-methyltransferase
MDLARLQNLLSPFLSQRAAGPEDLANGALSPTQLQSISTYIDLLLHWNARINLTAIRDPEEIVTRHFGESLFAASHLFPSTLANGQRPTANDVVDIGSGPGFPGLPIKIWAPQVQLTLIESNQKKATFLREVIRTLTLMDVDIFAGRAEDFPTKASVVTLRAVERFNQILPIATRQVKPNGRLALLIGNAQLNSAQDQAPDFHWQAPVPLPLASTRTLLIGRSCS